MIVLGYVEGARPLRPRGAARARPAPAAAAIVVDGEIVAASDEARRPGDRCTGVPERAIEHCLRAAGLRGLDEVDLIASADPLPPIDLLSPAPASLAVPAATRPLHALRRAARGALDLAHRARNDASARRARLALHAGVAIAPAQLVTVPHLAAHAASAFYASGLERALALVLDAHPGRASSLAAIGRGTRLEPIAGDGRAPRPAPSAGLAPLRAALARYLALDPAQPEAIAELAARGDPAIHRRFFREAIRIGRDGSVRVDRALLELLTARDALAPEGALYPRALIRALGPARRRGEPAAERHAHVAAALQEATEVAVLASLHSLRARAGERDLCLAGSLALDGATNASIARSGLFDRVHVPAYAADEGTAIGAALHACHHQRGQARRAAVVSSAYLGPAHDDERIDRAIAISAADVRVARPDDPELEVARAIAGGAVVAWAQGRAESGPRAIGARCVLADPRDPSAAERIRAALGGRDAERERAAIAVWPVVTLERAGELFDLEGIEESPFGLFRVRLRERARDRLRACGGDGACVQTVSWEQNPRLHALLHTYAELTGVPVLLQASLATADGPIVGGPEDALRLLLASELDLLVLGDRLIRRRPDARALRRAASARPLGAEVGVA